MSGKEIYCTKVRMEELDIFFASCTEGALRVGISWAAKDIAPVQYFKRYFPQERLIENKVKNLALIEAVISAYKKEVFVKIGLAVSFSLFQMNVLNTIRSIRPGFVKTYKQVAQIVNKPKAYRAVGQVLKKNPFPLLFP